MTTPSETTTAADITCAIIRASFEPYLRDALPAPQRKMLREHLVSCPDCRSAASRVDSTFGFARSVRDEVSEDDRRRILACVRTGVQLMEAERRIGGSRTRRLRIGSAAAAAVALVALLAPGWRFVRSGPAAQPASADAAVAAVAEPAAAIASAPAGAAFNGGLASAGFADGAVGAAAAPSDATVYDWNPGAGREEPRVVWIVDRGLDI